MTNFKSLSSALLTLTILCWLGCAQEATPPAEETVDHMEAGDDAPLSAKDQALVDLQKICPVGKSPLGGMGTPVKVMVEGQPVFLCCEHCREPLLKDPAKYLAVLEEAHAAGQEKVETPIKADDQELVEPNPNSKGLEAPSL